MNVFIKGENIPKQIQVGKETIIQEAKKLIEEKKFEELNCRSIAKRVGIGVGTLYHFFSSKDDILASVLLDDWKADLSSINLNNDFLIGIKDIYNCIYSFSVRYHSFWEFYSSSNSVYISFNSRHSILVDQISQMISKLLSGNEKSLDSFEVTFLAESILVYATRLYDFSKLEKIFIKIIGG